MRVFLPGSSQGVKIERMAISYSMLGQITSRTSLNSMMSHDEALNLLACFCVSYMHLDYHIIWVVLKDSDSHPHREKPNSV